MRYPYDNYTITCPYKKKGKLWKLGYHSGLDLVGKEKQVKAICDGTVRVTAYDPKGYGNYVSIQADDGKRILYCHLDIVSVCIGQRVKEGDVIGIEGSTGNSTGSHLHLEIRKSPYTSKSTIDPIEYIESNSNNSVRYLKEDNLHIVIIPKSKFKIIEWNKAKRTTSIKNYANGGFFASGKTTTEAMGNLVVESKVVSETCNSYGNLAGHKLHTFFIDSNDNLGCEVTDKMTGKNYKYAISGIPVTLNGQDVSWSKIVSKQGWTGGELYNTKHMCLSWDADNVYLIGIETKTKKGAYDTISEIWKRLKKYNFDIVLKLDGGGSTILDINGKNVFVSSGDRKVHNLIGFD